MIGAIAIALFALSAASEPVHIYTVEAPPTPGVYRIATTPAISNAWAVSRLDTAAVFDADGARVACEKLMRNSPMLTTPAHHAVEGRWLDENELAALTPIGGFAFNRVWAFDPPPAADTEKNVYFDIVWRMPVILSTAGDVQISTQDPRNVRGGPMRHLALRDVASHTGRNESNIYIDGFVLTGELRFDNARDVDIDHVVIDTAITRPWARAAVDEPGWILFKGNGRTPYRLQIGRESESCGGMGITWRDEIAAAPEWPPAATVGGEIVGTTRLGNPAERFEQRQADFVRRGWIRWSILVGILFVIACAIAIATDPRQRGDA